jgi:hypothetical protein
MWGTTNVKGKLRKSRMAWHACGDACRSSFFLKKKGPADKVDQPYMRATIGSIGDKAASAWMANLALMANQWMSNCSGWRAGSDLIMIVRPIISSNSDSHLPLFAFSVLTISGLTRSSTSPRSKCFIIFRNSV